MTSLLPLTPEQEDLYWLLTSSSIIKSLDDAADTKIIDGLYNIGISNRAEFLEVIANKCHLPARSNFKRLGFYAEALYHQFLSQHPSLDLLDQNIQIQHAHDGTTKGELDFLIAKCGKLIHLEMAVKFYLYDRHQQLFIGPNAKDRLDKKLNRLATHQLTLSSTIEGKNTLQLFGYTRAKSALLLKGVLFHHWQELPPNCTHTREFTINPKVEWGVWLYMSEWELFRESIKDRDKLKSIPKMTWMGLNSDAPHSQPLIMPTTTQPVGMWIVETTNQNENKTIIRAMVVEDSWPNIVIDNK